MKGVVRGKPPLAIELVRADVKFGHNKDPGVLREIEPNVGGQLTGTNEKALLMLACDVVRVLDHPDAFPLNSGCEDEVDIGPPDSID